MEIEKLQKKVELLKQEVESLKKEASKLSETQEFKISREDVATLTGCAIAGLCAAFIFVSSTLAPVITTRRTQWRV